MNKIIFGGAFDPIHLGHLNMARIASKELNADVIFVPSPISVWKKASAPIEDKIAMINLSIHGLSRFSVDLFEVESGKSQNYSIDTIRYFINKYPHDTFYYLIGADQVNEFHRWKEAEELSSLAHLIYLARPGYPVSEENIGRYHIQSLKGKVVDVSSSDIRDLKSLKVSDPVIDYIQEHNLYYIKKVRFFLQEKRYQHSVEVAKLAYKIARHHHIKDADHYYIAGLLHDIGKETSSGKMMVEHFPDFADLPPFSYHQFIGSYLAKEEFGITNKSILKAIEFHATGCEKMNSLGKVIYAADKSEPTRGYDSQYLIEAMMKDIDEGFKFVLQENKKFLSSHHESISNRLTSSCFDTYLK